MVSLGYGNRRECKTGIVGEGTHVHREAGEETGNVDYSADAYKVVELSFKFVAKVCN